MKWGRSAHAAAICIWLGAGPSRADAQDGPDTSALKWNPQTVAVELERYEPALAEFGIADPLRWARARIDEQTDWAAAQPYWERRIAHWRLMLLDDDPAGWSRWLDVAHPALADRRAELEAGGESARSAWAEFVRETKTDLLSISDDADLRYYLFLEQEGVYDADGRYTPDRAEALLRGVVQDYSLPPEAGEADHGWVQTANPAGWFIKDLAAAYYHQRDPKWAREFQKQIVAMALGDNYEPAGYTSVASRLSLALPTYLMMKDSPELSDRFHAIMGRWLWAHARQLHAVGAGAYKDNTLHHTAIAQWMAAALFPEFNGSATWEAELWPKYLGGWRRELLPDHCHEQRSIAYHCNFIRRAISLLGLAEAAGVANDLPPEFVELITDTVDVFVRMSTPTRSTPGVNDDVTVNWDYRPMLRLAADLCDRDDWRYLAADGRAGKAPPYLSVLLPHAQLGVMRSDWSTQARWLFFKVSPQGTAHHHRDTLGIQIWSGGRKLLIEPYVGDYAHERDIYNQSWWHSTPTLGATNLPYKVEPRVLHWETGDDLDYAIGQMAIPVSETGEVITVRRHVFFVDRAYWVLWDEFDGLPDGQVIWENFHLATRDVRLDEAGRTAATVYRKGPNLLMHVGTSGWAPHVEDTRMWPIYSHDTEPTATLHYEADTETATRGFAALFVPFNGRKAPRNARVDGIERLDDGRVRLEVSSGGVVRVLTTLSPE